MASPHIMEAAQWADAVTELRAGYPQKAAAMLRRGHAVPTWVADALADAITGQINLNPRGSGNRKLSLTDEAYVQRLATTTTRYLDDVRKNAPALADSLRMEISEVLDQISEMRKAIIDEQAKRYGVSTGTIEKAWKKRPRKTKPLSSPRD